MPTRHAGPGTVVVAVTVAGIITAGSALGGCGGPTPEAASRPCVVVVLNYFYPTVPSSGIYIGVDAGKAVIAAIERSNDQTLRSQLPAWRRATAMLSGASSGADAATAERHLQILMGRASGYCSTIGVPPAT